MAGKVDLIKGDIAPALLRFTLPMIAGALLQQCYNIADTLMVGRFIGTEALAAVGSAYTLMVFVTSVVMGLSMGAATLFSLLYGGGRLADMRRSVFAAFVFTGGVTLLLWGVCVVGIDRVIALMNVPADVSGLMHGYLWIVFYGLPLSFLYNFYAALLRAVGDSVTPLRFLGVSVVLNIILDLLFIAVMDLGVEGAAWATVVAQGVSAIWIMRFAQRRYPSLLPRRGDMSLRLSDMGEVVSYSFLTCLQQSVMNFGILMVQGLVNSFGTVVMAAFAVAVKIDSFAYMPVQEFGNAFSTFVAQNYGAGCDARVKAGMMKAFAITVLFSSAVSLAAVMFAAPAMEVFVDSSQTAIIAEGVTYLRTEGPFYFGIGMLFLWYGYFRAVRMPGVSVVLTVVSLGLRVSLAYALSAIPMFGVKGIWWSIPIGWLIADGVAWGIYAVSSKKRDYHAGKDEAQAADGVGHGVAHYGEGAVEAVLDCPEGGYGVAAAGDTPKGDGCRESEELVADID